MWRPQQAHPDGRSGPGAYREGDGGQAADPGETGESQGRLADRLDVVARGGRGGRGRRQDEDAVPDELPDGRSGVVEDRLGRACRVRGDGRRAGEARPDVRTEAVEVVPESPAVGLPGLERLHRLERRLPRREVG